MAANDIYPSASSLLPAFELAPSPMISSTSRSRRPHCPQQDCPVQSRSDVFSSLPWISYMDLTPEQLHMQDIADLSQIPLDESRCDSISSAGPVRRRKTSFRSSPLRPAAGSSHHRDRSPAPSLRSLPIASPTTPRPRSSPSRIIFHDLMPLFTCDVHNFRGATNSSPSP